MGGDHAPRVIVEGVHRALELLPGLHKLFLVGDRAQVEAEVARVGLSGDSAVEVVHAANVVRMEDSAASAIRSKRDSSIAVAVDLVKHGQAGAVVSAGNTGATVAATVVKLRTLPGL